MDKELQKIVDDTLTWVMGAIFEDGNRIGGVLPALAGMGANVACALQTLQGRLGAYHQLLYAQRQGPTATALRQRARVGAGLLRRAHQGVTMYVYQPTLDNSPEMAEEAIVYLTPFQAPEGIDLGATLKALLFRYLPSATDSSPEEFNVFTVQPLQWHLDAKVSPLGSIEKTPGARSYKLRFCFQDHGGSRRTLEVTHSNGYISVDTNQLYDALEGIEYPGQANNYTEEQLRLAVEDVFAAAGWSAEAYAESCWTAERWSAEVARLRVPEEEPQPLSSMSKAQYVSGTGYGGEGYFEWMDTEGKRQWQMRIHHRNFVGTDDGLPEIAVKPRGYELNQGLYSIPAHCLPYVLEQLAEKRAGYLRSLAAYWVHQAQPTGGEDD